MGEAAFPPLGLGFTVLGLAGFLALGLGLGFLPLGLLGLPLTGVVSTSLRPDFPPLLGLSALLGQPELPA